MTAVLAPTAREVDVRRAATAAGPRRHGRDLVVVTAVSIAFLVLYGCAAGLLADRLLGRPVAVAVAGPPWLVGGLLVRGMVGDLRLLSRRRNGAAGGWLAPPDAAPR